MSLRALLFIFDGERNVGMKRKWNINADDVIRAIIVILISVGIFMCGWICGYNSDHTVIDTYPVTEYIYIKEECGREHVEDVVVEEEPQDAPIEPVEAPEWPKLYTDEDAVALAKTLYGEARGVGSNGIVSGTAQKAAVIWCVLNRYDAGYEDSIVEVCAAPRQFVGYSKSHPVWDDLLELSYDVLDRWNAEKHGETDVGRVLPAEYLWFSGDGKYNHFRDSYKGGTKWGWLLTDPYAS